MKKLLSLLTIIFLIGCSGNSMKKDENYIKKTELELYNSGLKKYKNKKYSGAIQDFNSVKSIYPYSDLAKKSIFHLIDIYEKEKKYSDLLLLLDELMSEYIEYSDDEEIHYKYVNTFYKNIQRQLRDQELVVKSSLLLAEFLENFPDTKYRQDVDNKISLINSRLIYKEMEVGYFYELQRNYVAALKRYLIANKYKIINNYEPELLYRIYYCYFMIGLNDEGQKYFAELESKFRGDNWYNLAKTLKDKHK